MWRLLGILVSIAAAIGAAILTWPQFFRAERLSPFVQVVSFRAFVVLGCAVLVVLFLLLMLSRRMRGFAATLAAVALLTGVANGAILISRGLNGDSLPAQTSTSIRVMTWNTAGQATDPKTIARTAIAMKADIVALPETTIQTGTAVAVAMREGGQPMWAHNEAYKGWDANSTTLLISPRLGDYAVVESAVDGMKNTSTTPSVVARPVNGHGPTIVAAHTVAPRPDSTTEWSRDLQWLADQCGGGDVIMAGDFNATVDHMARLGEKGGTLGRCTDAASATGAAGVGTWPTSLPPLLGTPIDHVLTTSSWKATGALVLSSLDDSGSDHRPLIVQLEPVSH